MYRIFHSHFNIRVFSMFVFLSLISSGGYSLNAWGGTAGTSNQIPMKPVSCQEMLIELQNQLHAANQSYQLLHDENQRLNFRIEEAGNTIEELENTIRRIRNDVNRRGSGGGPVPQ